MKLKTPALSPLQGCLKACRSTSTVPGELFVTLQCEKVASKHFILLEAEDHIERVERRGLALSHSATSGLYAPGHITQSLYTPISSSVKGVTIILAHLSPVKGGNILVYTSLLSQGLRKLFPKFFCAIQIGWLSKPYGNHV